MGARLADVSAMAEPTYAELHRGHRARIRALCRMLLDDPEEAEDVVQEVFLALHLQRRVERRPMAWGCWLSRVAVNACRDRRRSAWWRFGRESTDELNEGGLAGGGPDPEEAAMSREQRALVWRAFRRLPARQREVFALRQVEGWSTEEVAEALGVSPGSVKRHLFRAVLRLRKALGGGR